MVRRQNIAALPHRYSELTPVSTSRYLPGEARHHAMIDGRHGGAAKTAAAPR
jgi:hypothetical protein